MPRGKGQKRARTQRVLDSQSRSVEPSLGRSCAEGALQRGVAPTPLGDIALALFGVSLQRTLEQTR